MDHTRSMCVHVFIGLSVSVSICVCVVFRKIDYLCPHMHHQIKVRVANAYSKSLQQPGNAQASISREVYLLRFHHLFDSNVRAYRVLTRDLNWDAAVYIYVVTLGLS